MSRRKEKIIGFLYYVVIFLSVFLLLIILQKKIDNMKEIHVLYSKNTIEIRTSNTETAKILKYIEEIDTRDVMIISEELHPFLELKGIYYEKKQIDIPILEGRFLTSDECQGNEDKIVIGYQFKNDVYEKNKRQYYMIDKKEYEVVGIIGDIYGSRFNTMIFLPFKTAANQYGTSGVYLIDHTEEVLVDSLLRDALNEQDVISVRKLYNGSILDFFREIKEDNGMMIIYIFLMFLITACSFLGINYCLNMSLSSIEAYKILGMPNYYIINHYTKKYFGILFSTFITSIILGIFLANILKIHLANYYVVFIGSLMAYITVNVEFILKIIISVRRVHIGGQK